MKKFLKFKEKLENHIAFKISRILLYIVVVMLLIVIVVQRFSNNNLSIGGYRIFLIVSESMKEQYKIGDILVSKHVSVDKIDVGDDVTYLGSKNNLKDLIITHRVIEKNEKDGKTYFITKGTSNAIADPEIEYSQIYGKVIYRTIFFSFLGRIMMNKVAGYILFIIIGILISIEIVSAMFSSDEEDGDDEQAE